MCALVHVYVRALIRDCRAHRVRNCDTLLCHTRDSGLLYINSEFEQKNIEKILSGGSLGSYVDEGRSKMREIV